MQKIITIVLAMAFFTLAISPTATLADEYDLQAEIDAACNGCTVVIPAGVYEIGDVVIGSNTQWQKVVTIQGAGHGHLGQSPPKGHSQWDYLLSRGYSYGTVLRGTISLVKGSFTGATTPKVYFRDLALIGHGAGIGIDYGDGVNMFPEGGIENVSIGNYDIGIRLRRAYYISISDVSMAGVGIGLQNIDSNNIVVSGLNIVACGVGLDVSGNGNDYSGSVVQSCEVGVRLGGLTGQLGGFYFEQTGISMEITGQGYTINSNYYASNSGVFRVSGKSNEIHLGLNPILPIELTSASAYNTIKASPYLKYKDAGFKNTIIGYLAVKQ